MIKEPNMQALIEYLRNDPDVSAIAGNRITHWQPISLPEDIFVTVSIRKQQQNDVMINPVLRFRALGHTDNVPLKTLYDLKNRITNALVKTDSTQHIDTWERFTQTSTSFTERLDSNRPMLEFWINGFLVRDVR